MDVQTAFKQRNEVTFVDVREDFEWAAGHIDGAIHIPLPQLPERFEELSRDHPIVAVCEVGQRSELAADFLRAQGFDAHNLEGGMALWARLLPGLHES